MIRTIPMAVVALGFMATSAAAQYSGQYVSRNDKPSYSEQRRTQPSARQQANQPPARPRLIGAEQNAEIARVRAQAGARQYRPIEVCDTDADFNNRQQVGPGRPNTPTVVGNVTVLGGGFCPPNRRR